MTSTHRLLELLATDCIREFRTANIHSILKVPLEADIEQIRKAIRNYSSRSSIQRDDNSVTTKSQIVHRFDPLVHDASLFLSYILLAKVRPFYMSPSDQSTIEHLKVENERLKRECQSSKVDICRLKDQLRNTRNSLATKEESLVAAEAELQEKTTSINRLEGEVMSLEVLSVLMFLCICFFIFSMFKSFLQFYFSIEVVFAFFFVLICILCCMVFKLMIEDYFNF